MIRTMSFDDVAHLNGMHWKSLEMEEQAYVRRFMRMSGARIVDKRVQIRNPSDDGYAVDYATAKALIESTAR